MRALVFGGTGQDGHYLIEHLIESGHEVVATRTRSSWAHSPNGNGHQGARWLWADLRDEDLVTSAVIDARPDVVFNLAAVTTPGASWLEPAATDVAEVNALGALRVLRAVDRCAPSARVVHASSSAIYDPVRYGLYGASKVFAHETVKGYRSRGLWASNAVLYSHTSPRQDPRFLVPHICRWAARVRAGSVETLTLAAPGSRRDWVDARDAVRALAFIAGLDEPGDYDVASGRQYSVSDVVDMVARDFVGRAVDMISYSGGVSTAERHADPRPLLERGWRLPTSGLSELVTEMVLEAGKEMGQ